MNRKRICLTLDLKDKPELIEKYVDHHKKKNNWPEINEGIRKSGIQMMDIYLVDNRMFMICEIDSGDDFDECWNRISDYPRQNEWAELMDDFIQAIPGHKVEWIKMEKVYSLRDA
jgi:L-rhamnose mutarotase